VFSTLPEMPGRTTIPCNIGLRTVGGLGGLCGEPLRSAPAHLAVAGGGLAEPSRMKIILLNLPFAEQGTRRSETRNAAAKSSLQKI
jgi:hypothetical protein